MFRSRLSVDVPGAAFDFWALALLVACVAFNVISNASFKLSLIHGSVQGFLSWQVVGNLAGFIGVLTLTGLLRYLPLHVAYPLTIGLTVVGVQVFAATLLFREAITPMQWVGTVLVILGICFISINSD